MTFYAVLDLEGPKPVDIDLVRRVIETMQSKLIEAGYTALAPEDRAIINEAGEAIEALIRAENSFRLPFSVKEALRNLKQAFGAWAGGLEADQIMKLSSGETISAPALESLSMRQMLVANGGRILKMVEAVYAGVERGRKKHEDRLAKIAAAIDAALTDQASRSLLEALAGIFHGKRDVSGKLHHTRAAAKCVEALYLWHGHHEKESLGEAIAPLLALSIPQLVGAYEARLREKPKNTTKRGGIFAGTAR